MERYWAINGRFLGQPTSGVQRYAREVIQALDSLLSEQPKHGDDLVVELLAPPNARSQLPLKTIHTRTVGTSSGHGWEQFALPFYARGGLISLCNTGPLAKKKQIVCIHDVNTRNYPHSYSFAFRSFYHLLLPALGRSAQAIATVSNHSAGDLDRYGICKRGKVLVAPNGHEHALSWQPTHSDATRAAAGPDTIVLMGSNIPHKNVGLILGMAQKLGGAGFRIAVIGNIDKHVYNNSDLNTAAANVTWLGRVTDDEFAALLRDSLCLAFPSFVEGFGLPPLEAMAIGCPVVVSDTASMPEVCGDAALYASPYNPEEWLEHFMRLRRETGLREQMIMRGWARTRRYRWGATARLYLDLMAQMDGIEIPPTEKSAAAVSVQPSSRRTTLERTRRFSE
jgi:glycosyltransferase involved in cell wall biosynthesis